MNDIAIDIDSSGINTNRSKSLLFTNITDAVLVFVLLFVSGNLLATYITEYIYIVLLVILVLLYPVKSYWTVSKTVYFLLFILIIFIIQRIILGFVSIPGAINFFARFLTGYLIVKFVGNRFADTYLKVIYYLSLISLAFFAYVMLSGNIPSIFTIDKYNHSVIIYNHLTTLDGVKRNSGMFWEPGAFQGYLNLVPMLFIDRLPELWKKHKKECIVLILALITTGSTTGYIVFFMILFYQFTFKQKNILFGIVTSIVLIGSFLFVFSKTDFLGKKVNEQYENAMKMNVQAGEVSTSRIGSAIIDWHYIQKHPLFGNGLHAKTRWADHYFLGTKGMTGYGNGFTWMTASMGIVFMIVYFFLLYKNLPFNRFDKWWFIILIFLLLQGEQFLNFPLFFALPFIEDKIV